MKKEKNNKYNFACSLDLFPFDIYFSIGENNKEFDEGIKKYLFKKDYLSLKKLDEKLFKLTYTTSGRCCHNFDTGQTVIRIREYLTAKDQGTLAHEIKHAIDYIIWHNLGMKPVVNNEELFAYCIGYITKKCFEQIYKK